MPKRIVRVTIDMNDVKEEVNDTRVLRNWRAEGPLYRLPSGEDVRVPNTGFVVEEDGVTYEFTLSGFGKLDRKPVLAMDHVTQEALLKFMGRSYNLLTVAHKQEVVRVVRRVGRDAFFRKLRASYDPGEGRLNALNRVLLGLIQSEPDTRVLDAETLKAMGLE